MSIPLFKLEVNERDIELVNEVLTSQNKESMVTTLEEDIQKYIGCSYAVSTMNATAALHLSLRAMDLKRGDKVICSVNSFPAVAEVIRHFDAEPIFVDIDKDDFNIDPKQFERTLNLNKHKKLKAAFIGHVAGQPSELDEIYELANANDIKIIDDATQIMGGTYKGKKIGSTGSHISCFRFGSRMRNPVSTAGFLVTEDEEINERARLLRNHAIQSDEWDEHGNIGYIYDVVDIGLKYDLSELCAAFSVGQLANFDNIIKRRQEIAGIYNKELANCPHVSTPVKKREHTYSKYIIKIDKNRDHFARQLKEKGISTGLHFVPLHLLKYYKEKYSLKINDFPVALSNYQYILSIPIHSSMSNEDVMRVCEAIKQIAQDRV